MDFKNYIENLMNIKKENILQNIFDIMCENYIVKKLIFNYHFYVKYKDKKKLFQIKDLILNNI